MNADVQYTLMVSLLWAVSFLLLIIPFYPAWREWSHPTDDTALVVVAGQTRNSINVARYFREKMLLDRTLPALASRSINKFGTFEQKSPIYTTDSLKLFLGGKLTEVFTEGSLILGAQSHICGWAHAEEAFELGEESIVVRRISSSETISIARKCYFEKLHAPMIFFGDKGIALETPKKTLNREIFYVHQVAGATPWGNGGWRVKGDVEIPEACFIKGSLVVTGLLTIGANCQVLGDLKAYQGIYIGANTEVVGAIFSEGAIHISRNSDVAGPIVSDSHLLIGYGSVIGSVTAPTTITANSILVGNRVLSHGTVWARQAGMVWGQT